MRLIEGAVMPDADPDSEMESLQQEIADLRRELSQARTDTARSKRDAAQSLGNLRKLLKPWYQALQMIYGELDAAGVDDESFHAASPRTSAVWDQWKQKLDKGCSKAIDALLMHGEMTRRQLAIATGYSPQNVSNIVSRLSGASLIVKNGDRISLRQL